MSIIKQKVVIGDCVLYQGDCIEVMRGMAENSVDSIVCDPPYLLGFMGKAWDAADGIAGQPEVWREALRVLKPGGHLLAFGAPRTNHRMVTAIEDAGFEIRDSVMWVFASGFPKSLDVSKAIDKAAGAERIAKANPRALQQTASINTTDYGDYNAVTHIYPDAATEAAKQWQGFGTALKPAYEPICVARKPLAKGNTVAANVLQWGTGGINIDGCRVDATDKTPAPVGQFAGSSIGPNGHSGMRNGSADALGRWPANLILDGSPEVLAGLPVTKTGNTKAIPYTNTVGKNVFGRQTGVKREMSGDEGSAARYFYCAKASKKDRDEGLAGMPEKQYSHDGRETPIDNAYQRNASASASANFHPTVKPTSLMAYLCRLVTPPGGIVLDIFMGSGSTGKAAALVGFAFAGIEMDAGYFAIARQRIEQAHSQGQLFQPERAAQVQGVLA